MKLRKRVPRYYTFPFWEATLLFGCKVRGVKA